jgi:hypothetical protein
VVNVDPGERIMRRKLANVSALATFGLLVSVGTVSANVGGTTTYGSAQPAPGARTIPYFTDSFTFGGVVYPYRMVGTNPRTSRATTTVPTLIVPLRLVFADGHVAEPLDVASRAAGSPLFQSARFTSGTTQYGDAIQRAMFWKYVAKTDYHVLLAQPLILPTQTLDVPQGQGTYLQAGDEILPGFHAAVSMGIVSSSWFFNAYSHLLVNLQLDARTLPILLSRNVLLSGATAGFHSFTYSAEGNGSQPVQTAIWVDYADPYTAKELPGIFGNVDTLSHEVSEWLADPFGDNVVPAWQSPLPLAASHYGCTSLLETGDPLVDVSFQMNGYQLQDEAFLSWFAHQTPSIGIKGQYTYLGTFGEPSPLC